MRAKFLLPYSASVIASRSKYEKSYLVVNLLLIITILLANDAESVIVTFLYSHLYYFYIFWL